MFDKKTQNVRFDEQNNQTDEANFIADFDDTLAQPVADEGESFDEGSSDDSSNFIEIEEDLSQFGFVFDAESDTAFVDDAKFDELVDKDGFFEFEFETKDEETGKVVKEKKRVFARRAKTKVKPFGIGTLTLENYGVLRPFIEDVNVTDINWNGKQLWIDDTTKGRYLSDIVLDKEFVDAFSVRVSNVVSKAFNKYTPRLEAESSELRITIVHESVCHTGRAISIRKTPAVKRINFMESIKSGDYCSEEVANLMSNAIKAKMNVIICGLPGVGKTELVKYLTNYIFPFDRAITIEDTLELHYADINPGKDCMELKVNDDTFTYTDAIKASLRLLPQWVLLSEARSTEVSYLLESVSTGTKCITTLHTDDVRKIPDRVLNMIGAVSDKDAILNSIYNFFDVGILIDKKQDEKTGKINRWVSQFCLFDRENGKNSIALLVDNGELTSEKVPTEAMKKFNKAGIKDPYKYTFI